MNKRLVLCIASFAFLLSFHIASANILINEIMYDADGTDTDREWIELYNSGTESIDLSGYKFFEANSNHGLTLEEGDKNISPSGYAVIVQDKVKFKTDYPNFSGSIFRASFSLNNEGEALSIKDPDLNVVDSYSYLSTTGGVGDGKSLQKVSGTWVSGAPTPGAVNASTNTNSENTNNNQNTNSANQTTSNATSNTNTSFGGGTNISQNKKIETNILAPSFGFVNLPITFEAKTTGTSGEDLHYGKYYWNFGDGTSLDQDVIYANKFTHTFYYPQDYEIRLLYFGNPYSTIPTASNVFTIKVIPASIVISAVGDESDFFIELTNNTEYNADISEWSLVSLNKIFILPKNTYIQSKNKMILAGKITNFVKSDENNLKLMNRNGELVFDYGSYIISNNTPKIKKAISVNTLKVGKEVDQTQNNSSEYISFPLRNDTQGSNLEANILSGVENTNLNKNNNIILFIGFAFLILLGIGGVYYIQKRGKKDEDNGDDFEITE